MNVEHVDVAVVGAGLAGLAAADRLCAAGRSVRVLEARPRVGGRTEGGRLCGAAVDIGGQWVGPTQHRVLALCQRFGLALTPQYADGRRLLDFAGRVRPYRGTLPRLSPLALLDAARAIRRIDRLAARLDPAQPWALPEAAAWDRLTAEAALRRITVSRDARRLLAMATRAIWSCEPHELSWLWLLTYVAASGGFETLAEVHGDGAQQWRIDGGAFQLADRLAAALPAGCLRLSSPVRAIRLGDDRLRLRYDGGELDADRVIVAVPPVLAGGIDIDGAAGPGARRLQWQQRMPMGSVIKALVAYDRPFWRDAGLSGEAVSDQAPFSPVFDASPADGSRGVLVGFFEAAQGRALAEADSPARRAAAVACLIRYFGPQAATPLAYVEKNWIADPWSRGGYTGLAQPGALTAVGDALRAPTGRLHWAGTETATRWIGYMDGALESGDRAADEVIAAGGR